MWSAVETMSGNQVTRACVHDSVSRSTGCAPRLLGDAKNNPKRAEKAAGLRKVTLLFLLDTTLWQYAQQKRDGYGELQITLRPEKD
jgi:hypothetical protein